MLIKLEDGLLRLICNNLPFISIKNINITCKIFNNLQYKKQCIPHGIYRWIYGIREINNDNRSLNRYYLKSEYSFDKYIKDIIMFLDEITIGHHTIYYYNNKFKNYKINDNGNKILLHNIYNVSLGQYYQFVINSGNLKALIY